MKKFLSIALVVLMLASLTVCAFADDNKKVNSVKQDADDTGADVVVATTPKTEDEDEDEEALADAEEAETEAAEAIEDASAEDEDGEEVEVALGMLPANATDEMKADFEALADALVDAKEALAADEAAAIPADVKADADEGAEVVAGPAFRAVASKYPATITISVENPDDFVGMMAFVNGKWVKLDTVVNDDGTVTFVLEEPSVLSIVSQVVKAA